MKIYVCNYADDRFAEQQQRNTKSAYTKGKADAVFSFAPADIDTDFRNQHKHIFSYQRGGGLWIWKPYIILKALQKIDEGDWLFYNDSGAVFVNDLHRLVDGIADAKEKDIFCFELPLKNRQYCKHEAMDYLHIEDKNENQIMATFLLLRNCERSQRFVKEWIEWMSHEILLVPEKKTDLVEYPDFISHREDQSVFTMLCIKWGLEVFRDPSDYGIRPYLYAQPNRIYAPKLYSNSNYPKIMVHYRAYPYLKYRVKEKLFSILGGICPNLLEKLVLKWHKVEAKTITRN